MADIFLSYAREDKDQAQRLAEALRAAGLNVWWDMDSLRSGTSFGDSIHQALERADRVLVLWSANSIGSRWVKAEAYFAWEKDKLHSVKLAEDVKVRVPFNESHTRDLAAWDGGIEFPELQRLLADIDALIGFRDSGRVTSSFRTWEPLTTFRDPLRDGEDGPEMVVIPAGSFQMGSPTDEPGRWDYEGPRHLVEIPQLYALGKTPVTFAAFDFFAEVTGHEKLEDSSWGRGNRPVIDVNWEQAVAYADWLSGQTGKRYRLPTEAEWEYACRAGARTRRFFGENEADLAQYAWYQENSDDKTHPVGQKELNPWGLHDVYGNVWEWVQDCWHDNYRGAPTDGSAWLESGGGDCRRRVVRGGSWGIEPVYLRSACRNWGDCDNRNNDVGFRLAEDL